MAFQQTKKSVSQKEISSTGAVHGLQPQFQSCHLLDAKREYENFSLGRVTVLHVTSLKEIRLSK
jgi:hypothetical protein